MTDLEVAKANVHNHNRGCTQCTLYWVEPKPNPLATMCPKGAALFSVTIGAALEELRRAFTVVRKPLEETVVDMELGRQEFVRRRSGTA